MSAKNNYTEFAVTPHLDKFNVPFNTFRANYPQYERFIGGGLIFSQNTESQAENNGAKALQALTPTRLRVLLQRASTDAYPELWEGPGGSSEDEDKTILETVAREIWEETGLRVLEFVEFVGILEWEKPAVGMVGKFTFIVKVATGSNPQLKPVEHQGFAWATEEELREEGLFKSFGEQRQIILDGFDILTKKPGMEKQCAS